jgi:hypothetical protein
MPSLIRFVTIIALAAGAFYGSMFLLATVFEPSERELTSVRTIKLK